MSLGSSAADDLERPVPLPDCGQKISVESPHQEEKLWTQMVGFKRGAYLILEKPAGADVVDGMRALCEGDSIVIRFIKDGIVYGFRTPILRTLSVPYKLLFVAYPVEVVRHSLRSSPRLQCYLPCDGRVGDRLFSRAFIRDFSATGCQLRIPLDAFVDEEVSLGDGDSELGADGDLDLGGAADSDPAAADPESAPGDGESAHGGDRESPQGDDRRSAEGGGPAGPGQRAPAEAKRLTLNLHLPGELEMRVAEGDVLEWQSLPRYHVVRVKFDEPQLDVFEQLSLYTTQLG